MLPVNRHKKSDRPSADHSFNLFKHLFGFKGLCNGAPGAGFNTFARGLPLAVGKKYYYGGVRVKGFDFRKRPGAVRFGHHRVQKDKVGFKLLIALYRLLSVGGFAADFIAVSVQNVLHHHSYKRRVVAKQDSL